MSAPEAKGQKTGPEYSLLYHPAIPGRGEFIRLAFRAAGVSYSEPAKESKQGFAQVLATWEADSTGGNPPHLSPPWLRVSGAGKAGKDLVLSQTPNILIYLGPKLGLVGDGLVDLYFVNGVALTALDLNNEAHDTHHPVAVMKYYEDQKDEALKKASDFREHRIPKFFSYFERVLKANESEARGKYLIGSKLTYADTTVWQVLDGLLFAFPKELEARKKEFSLLFDTFYAGLKDEDWLNEYLSSKDRLEYSMGIFRHYPELDRQ